MDWNTFGAFAAAGWSLFLLAFGIWTCLSRTGVAIRKRGRGNLLLFAAFAAIATAMAQKTNSPPRGASGPDARQDGGLAGRQNPADMGDNAGRRDAAGGQTRGIPVIVTPDEIARGYRLEYTTNDAAHSFVMPTNASLVGNWHVHGAASPFGMNRLDFGDDWRFPLGSNHESFSSFWLSPDARLRPTPRDMARELSLLETPMRAVPGLSRLWLLAVDGGERILTWERFFVGEGTNVAVDAQIVLCENGDFSAWSNDTVSVYRRIDPDDWDGDGLANTIDPQPMAGDGDFFGTCAEWYNANCGAVLSAEVGTNGETAVTWNDGVCENAYYWLEFRSTADGNTVWIECDGASNLGDMTVIAMSNQTCRVPLLAGATYHVTAEFDLADISASDSDADIYGLSSIAMDRGAGGMRSSTECGPANEFFVELPLDFGINQDPPCISLTTSPRDVGAVLAEVSGACCATNLDLDGGTWQCEPGCECEGFGHAVEAVAAWEGYSKSFGAEMRCECQYENMLNPEAWFSFSCPSLLMRNGNAHTVSGVFEPPEATNCTLTLTCVAGAGKIRVLEGGDSWKLVQGAETSDHEGDVRFELRLELDGDVFCKTQSLTVACVTNMAMTSAAAGTSATPPPFAGETACPFSVTNSPVPDRHLVVPFCNVVNTNDFSVDDFAVEMELVLFPDVSQVAGDAEWSIVENTVNSGNLVSAGGLAARFVNPKRGGVVRFSASYDGSPATEGCLVLPLAGASVDYLVRIDKSQVDMFVSKVIQTKSLRQRTSPWFGLVNFYFQGNGDYLGRPDNSERHTVWCYNQVDTVSHFGMGAVCTWAGKPIRVSKLSDFIVGYACEGIGVSTTDQNRARLWLGTKDDLAAADSWLAGVAVANGSNYTHTVANMVRESWHSNDLKTIRLWPNSGIVNNVSDIYHYGDWDHLFYSPGVMFKQDP